MIDLRNNPYSNKNGTPKSGKELEWLNWNSEKRQNSNPHVDKDGNIKSYDGFSEYMDFCQKSYNSDLNKLPIELKEELKNNTRLLSERMQVEATGHR